MILSFPLLHPELLPEAARAALPEALRFLDPGLAKSGSPEHFRPEGAPFDPRTARALLADTLRYGESLANPRDILAQSLVQRFSQDGGLSPESSRAVLGEVEQSMAAGKAPEAEAADALREARSQAQLLLLLAWNLEERLLELRGIEGSLRTAWSRLGQSVTSGEEAVDEADSEALNLGRELSNVNLPDATELALPWRKLLESYATLSPEAFLCTTDPEIDAALAEAGVPEGPLAAMTGAARVFQAPAWRFLGLDRAPEARPWLEATVRLGYFSIVTGKE